MGRRRRQIRHSDQRGRATRVGAAPIIDFTLSNDWSADPAGDGTSFVAEILFGPGETKTSIPVGIRDDETIDGTNTLVWVLDEKARFGFKKEVYIFSEDDDTNTDLDTPTFKPIKLVKGSDVKAVTILIEDNDGSPTPVKGTNKDDVLKGKDNATTLYGLKGNDELRGFDGNDSLYGFEGKDDIYGGRDDDDLYGHAGRDRIYGEIGNDQLDGGTGDDLLNGGHGNDQIFGWLGDDTLIGEKGNDELYGEGGDDILDGGIGNDVLDGGSGTNSIMTGDGLDTVVVQKQGLSIVSDFEVGSDRLQLTQNLTFGALSIVQQGQDALIQFNSKTLIVLENTDATAISAADFI